MTPDGKRLAAQAALNENTAVLNNPPNGKVMEEDFFDMLTKSQSKRMDDQRCSLKVLGGSVGGIGTKEPAASMRKPLTQQNSMPISALPKENRYVK